MIGRRFLRPGVTILAGAALLWACSTTDATSPAASSSGSAADASAVTDDATAGGDGAATPSDGSSGGNPSQLIAARPYAKTVPAGYDANAPTPLVLLLHGYTANGKGQDDYFKMSALAETKTFLVAVPDGTKDTQGNRFWNASDACCDFFAAGVDDVAYLTAVIADMKASYNVDPKRVYVVGHSNGGFMAHRLACELSKDIAGIVSLAGATYQDAAKCKATDPVAVLQVHGDADQTVAYAGGTLFAGGVPFPGAKETVAAWATRNGCAADLTTTADKLDLDTGLAGDETTIARHTCTKGAAELWTIVGGSHIPTFGATWADLIYGFLQAHPKP